MARPFGDGAAVSGLAKPKGSPFLGELQGNPASVLTTAGWEG
jgi:hypothetical protein